MACVPPDPESAAACWAQARLSERELEAVGVDLRRLEVQAEEREVTMRRTRKEQSRLRRALMASEAELEQSTRVIVTLRHELKVALSRTPCHEAVQAIPLH